MNAQKSTPAESIEESEHAVNSDGATSVEHRRFMNEHTSCAMCDSPLEIRHEIHMNELKVKEEAHCLCCGLRVRSSHHLMH